jgi:hypothetical protein
VNSLNPNVQWCNRTLVGSTSVRRRHREPPVRLSPGVRLARGAMRNERIEGHEWGAYVVLVRSSVTEHGMAYGPRGLGSRSANSSRGRDAPPGSAGKPRAGRSGAGGGMIQGCEVRGMRNAEAAQIISRSSSMNTTGERLKIERLTSRSEGGRWKRAKWHLAGGLPYCLPGLGGGSMKPTDRETSKAHRFYPHRRTASTLAVREKNGSPPCDSALLPPSAARE